MYSPSGTSKTGTKHRYYHCCIAKKKKTCEKKCIIKNYAESKVVDNTLQLLNDIPIVNYIVDTCYELQFNKSANLPGLEEHLSQTQTKIDNLMNAIMQGITTPTTKETLLKLEEEKSSLEIAIAKEKIERPTLDREKIKDWICRFRLTNLDNEEQKRQLIDVFVKEVHIYNDKMLIIFNYKDGEVCVTFDEIKDVMKQKENPDNQGDCQGSPIHGFGGETLPKK